MACCQVLSRHERDIGRHRYEKALTVMPPGAGPQIVARWLTAFDNFRQEYINTWIDSMGTCLMISRGTASADGNVINYQATMDDPATDRKDLPMRSVARFEGDDTHIVEMYCTDPSGKEFQNMEIVYKRQK